eukprot:m51a1_g12594 hypothetical protein (101) ;mRNA; r:3587-3931
MRSSALQVKLAGSQTSTVPSSWAVHTLLPETTMPMTLPWAMRMTRSVPALHTWAPVQRSASGRLPGSGSSRTTRGSALLLQMRTTPSPLVQTFCSTAATA